MFPAVCPVCKQRSLKHDKEKIFCSNCQIYQKPLNFTQKVAIWTNGKWWWWRLPIVGWFAVMLVQNLKNPQFALNRVGNPFSALDLGIHELGHIIFLPFGEFVHILGGSLFQCLFPIIWMFGCLQKKWYFGAAMSWCWLGLNFFDVAAYANDARSRLLPLTTGLSGLGDQGSNEAYDKAHDWYQLLSRTHHLDWDHAISNVLRIVGTTCFIIGITLGLILIFSMIIGSTKKSGELNN